MTFSPGWIQAVGYLVGLAVMAGVQLANHRANTAKLAELEKSVDVLKDALVRLSAADPAMEARVAALEAERQRMSDKYVGVATALALLEERTRNR